MMTLMFPIMKITKIQKITVQTTKPENKRTHP